MRRFLLTSLIFLLSCGAIGVAAPATQAQTLGVSIYSYAFHPSVLNVPVGATVTWTNNDPVAHTVTSDSGLWNSGPISPGGTFSYTFTTPGTYTYHCMIHPYMTGEIVVGGAPATSPTVTVTPSTVAAGSTATVAGAGFTPNYWAFVYWQRPDGTTNGIWQFTSSTGTFSFTLGFDPAHGTGPEYLAAYDYGTGQWSPIVTITVTGVSPPPPTTFGLAASPNPVHVGNATTVSGTGFSPNNYVFVQWVRPDGTTGGTFVFTDPAGNFAFTLEFLPVHGCGNETLSAYDYGRNMVSPSYVITVSC
jgi:plastocyanin